MEAYVSSVPWISMGNGWVGNGWLGHGNYFHTNFWNCETKTSSLWFKLLLYTHVSMFSSLVDWCLICGFTGLRRALGPAFAAQRAASSCAETGYKSGVCQSAVTGESGESGFMFSLSHSSFQVFSQFLHVLFPSFPILHWNFLFHLFFIYHISLDFSMFSMFKSIFIKILFLDFSQDNLHQFPSFSIIFP